MNVEMRSKSVKIAKIDGVQVDIELHREQDESEEAFAERLRLAIEAVPRPVLP